MRDILEPVELYRSTYKDAHARNTSEFFESLVKRSGVDEQANVKTVKELRALEAKVKKTGTNSQWWNALRMAVVMAAIACGLLLFYQLVYAVAAVVCLLLMSWMLSVHIKGIDSRLAILQKQCDEKLAEAWEQTAALNQLYDWRIFADLVKRTIPIIELDPYFTNGRLRELRDIFGWTNQVDQDVSVVFAHSGQLNGNPLVVAQRLDHWMGTKTYHGSLKIQWLEHSRDSQGKRQSITRTQTLSASVERPFPEYGERKFVIYGNEVAPDLSFTREPSGLSSLGNGLISIWRKAIAVNRLKAKSRDMKNSFTIMSNRVFESLFNATNRDNEVQFRLLFTPLAQQEMVKLLKDKTVGYGDDFTFIKEKMINMVESLHMQATDINTDPLKFHAYEIGYARKFFNEFHNNLFKSVFFGMAPLLTIPLYQQHRSCRDIYGREHAHNSSFWEHESIANYFGESQFQHPDCVTRSIIKTQATPNTDGTQLVRVSAFGYRSLNRTAYVERRGGDGSVYDVPVEWTEYIDVRRDSEMLVQDRVGTLESVENQTFGQDWQMKFINRGVDPQRAILRRSIIAAIR